MSMHANKAKQENQTSGQSGKKTCSAGNCKQQPNNPLWEKLTQPAQDNLSLQRRSVVQTQSNPPEIQKQQADTEAEPLEQLPTIQTKLSIGAPNDPYEQEADAVADQVMRMPASPSLIQPSDTSPASLENRLSTSPMISRKACPWCEKQAHDEPVPQVQTKSAVESSAESVPRIVHQAVANPGAGSAVNESIRHRVEAVLGADLSGARVHNGMTAGQASHSINAKAFTHQNHIFLGAGQSANDLGLMAHELTHVVQQGKSPALTKNSARSPYLALKPVCQHPYSGYLYHPKLLKKLIKIKSTYPSGEARLPALKTLSEEVPEDEKPCLHKRLSKTTKDSFTDYLKVFFPKTRTTFLDAIHPTSPRPIRIDSGIPDDAYDDEAGECKSINSCQLPEQPKPKSSATPSSSSLTANLDIQGNEWTNEQKPGIAFVEGGYGKGGANLRIDTEISSQLIIWLPPNTHVFILKHNPKKKRYAVVVLSGAGGKAGFVADWLIAKNLPDPEAKLYKVKSGDTALGIAYAHYTGKEFNAWGRDKRYLVNALSWVNKQHPHSIKGGPGIVKNNDDSAWDTAIAYEDAYTWIPGSKHMLAIYNQIVKKGGGTGSISADLWNKLKKVGEYAAYGLAFVGGLVHGFLKSLYDAVAGLIGIVWDILVSIFTGSVIKDATELWKAISGLTWEGVKEALGNWTDSWFVKLNNHDPWVSGHAHGYLTGYIMAEAAQLLLTAGTAAAVKSAAMGTKIGKAIQATRAYRLLVKGMEKASGASSKARSLFAKAGQAVRKSKPFKSLAVARQWLVDAIGVSLKTAKQISLYGANRLRGLSDSVLDKLKKMSEAMRRKLLGCHSPCDCDPGFVTKHIDNPSAAKKAASPDAHPPKHFKTKKYKSIDDLPKDSAGNFDTLPKNVIYEFDGGHRIWRDADGAIRHESAIGDALGRSHLEKEFFSAGKHGNPKYKGMERAHSLGQGTGFESPFGLYYAPRFVNQTLQNNGIELFLRQLHKKMPSGETLHVATRTTAHTDSLLLKEMVYSVFTRDASGKKKSLFDYAISVANDAPNPTVSHGVKSISDGAKITGLMDKVSGADTFKALLRNFISNQ